MSEVNPQLLRKCWKQFIVPGSRWHYVLYNSESFRLVQRSTSNLRYEWRENQLLRKCWKHFIVPVFQWLMTFVHFASLSLVRRLTSILRHECCEISSLRKCRKQLLPPVLRSFWWLLYILQVYVLLDAQTVFSIISEGGLNFLESASD